MRQISELIDFLTHRMRMTGIYQPVVILKLLESGGSASKAELAKELSGYDESVQKYYEKILMRWPYDTLGRKHDIVRYDRKSKRFSLGFSLDDVPAVERAKSLCREKVDEWLRRQSNRGDGAGVGASVRYRVLKRAKGRCELCGISAKVSPIDVDHIVPRNWADREGRIRSDAGIRMPLDDERNLQALCFKCNRAKRDQDSTDFRLPSAKLVRDRIPEIIRESGDVPRTRELRGEQLKSALLDKLVEEHSELQFETNEDEIADMIEVLLALANAIGSSEDQTMRLLQEKRRERGGFEKGMFLERVEPA